MNNKKAMYIVVVLCRLLGSFFGIFLQFIIVLAILALATWNTKDPSSSHANINEISNLLGFWGAFYADLNMQFLGLSSIVALIPPFIWGLLLAKQRTIYHFFRRLFCWIASIIFFGTGLAFLPSSTRWPQTIAVGQGGLLGDILANIIAAFLDIFSNIIIKSMLVLVFVVSSCFLIAYASCFLGNNEKQKNSQNRQQHRRIQIAMQDILIFLQRFYKKIPQNKQKTSIFINKLCDVYRESCQETREGTFDTKHLNNSFKLPPISCLKVTNYEKFSRKTVIYNVKMLSRVLEDFGIQGNIISVCSGPVVTLYELKLAPGIKYTRVISLSHDIAHSMSTISARIWSIGRNIIGIELPNPIREIVSLREILETKIFQKNHTKLGLALGKTISGKIFIADLTKMPHLLIAGTAGSGKSVTINVIILSILYRMTPEECRIIMIDSKILELSIYDGIPHLLTPIVTDPPKAVIVLKWAVREMEERYRNMAKLGVPNIDGFNECVKAVKKQKKTFSRTVQTGFNKKTGEPIFETEELALSPIPYIVVIINEMAELMMMASKEIETAIQQLAQMARAAGIHVIMATQYPSVHVITGVIKANCSTRISFHVTSKCSSRAILGEQGAEQLLGQGDMLLMMGERIQRIHGPFVQNEDVKKVIKYLKMQGIPKYLQLS